MGGGAAGVPRLGHGDLRKLSPRRRRVQAGGMSGTYKLVDIVGTSSVSFADAVKAAVADAGKTVRHMDWFEVSDLRGRIADGEVVEFQVTVKIGFKIER